MQRAHEGAVSSSLQYWQGCGDDLPVLRFAADGGQMGCGGPGGADGGAVVSLPIVGLSAALAVLVVRGGWRERDVLERLCGANLVVDLGTTTV